MYIISYLIKVKVYFLGKKKKYCLLRYKQKKWLDTSEKKSKTSQIKNG